MAGKAAAVAEHVADGQVGAGIRIIHVSLRMILTNDRQDGADPYRRATAQAAVAILVQEPME